MYSTLPRTLLQHLEEQAFLFIGTGDGGKCIEDALAGPFQALFEQLTLTIKPFFQILKILCRLELGDKIDAFLDLSDLEPEVKKLFLESSHSEDGTGRVYADDQKNHMRTD